MRKKILIAEDEPVLRMLIADTLEDEGYEIEEASDGVEALDKMKADVFDLIILDYMMPRMTGAEVIEAVKAESAEERQPKILMLSAKSQQAEQEKMLKAGADGFMSKPFSPLELIGRIGEMLRG